MILQMSPKRETIFGMPWPSFFGGCAAANNSKVSHSIHWFLYDIQLTHFSVSLNSVRLGVSCVLEDRGPSIGSLGFHQMHQIPGHSWPVKNFEADSRWVHWNMKTATRGRRCSAISTIRSGASWRHVVVEGKDWVKHQNKSLHSYSPVWGTRLLIIVFCLSVMATLKCCNDCPQNYKASNLWALKFHQKHCEAAQRWHTRSMQTQKLGLAKNQIQRSSLYAHKARNHDNTARVSSLFFILGLVLTTSIIDTGRSTCRA